MGTSVIRSIGSLCLLAAVGAPLTAAEPDGRALVARAGILRGICSVPRCGTGDLALAIARESDLLVHAFDADAKSVDEAVERALRARLLAHRVSVERVADDPLPYADGFVDLIVVDDAGGVRAAEVFRVVRPLGCALVRNSTALSAKLGSAGFEVEGDDDGWTLARKPAPTGADDWTHWSHGPDNNPVSADAVIRAPYVTQWFAKPYYHAMPVVSTAAAGRVFIASGHIAHHDREIPTLNTLVARNGYNGRVLWQRGLPDGYLVHRSAFIATEHAFYMIDGDGILMLDPETGSELGRHRVPETQGTLKWMAKVGDVAYVLAGEDEPPAETMKVHATFRGWGWNNVDKSYSPKGRHQIRWGFGNTLAAYDLAERKLLWKHEQSRVDSRGMGILNHRLFYYVPGARLACLDRRSGATLWVQEDREKLALIEEEARGLAGTPGFRTTAMLLPTPVGVFIQGQKRMNVAAFSLDDGRFLWSKRKYHNNPNMLYTKGKLFISGIEKSGAVQVIDPQTGSPLEDLHFHKGSCTRLTGSPEALYCRGEGLGRYDFEKKLYWAERSARPGCNDGAIPANGLLYVGPWLCDCNLSILGQMVLGPAGDFDAHGQTLSDSHLEASEPRRVDNVPAVDDRDWPVYRANNRRTASSAATLPSTARLLWRCRPQIDGALQNPPVTAAGCVFTAGEDGFLRCLDAERGTERWSLATGGPLLASPTVWQGRLFAGSGDGYLYCVEAATGKLLWRFRVAPLERRIMVYGRLASRWPVNSGVLVHDEKAYAAAGIVFRDGTHVVALDARSGKLRWHNGTVGRPTNERFELRAASAMGTLAIGKGRLWLASGNVVAPVSFDLKSGQPSVAAARRVPVWNTVMAQKPEPAGRDVMVFGDRFLMHGGRLLYSGEGQVVTSAQVNFRAIDAEGRLAGPAFTPVRHCAVPPAWDDEVFITPTSRYGDVVGWSVSDVEKRLADALALMTKMDRKIPGESPEKWGQYNQIGQVFGAVERELRAASLWPVVRAEVYAVAVANSAVVMAGREKGVAGPCFAAAYAKTDGKPLWKVELPFEPRLGGLAVDRHGRVVVALGDGSIVCVGE
ncbi:MAG: outer membrane protein assembly factor BamB family protein [Planctomycetota bacterium]|jgi:outer membrane protein assembly factor BamB